MSQKLSILMVVTSCNEIAPNDSTGIWLEEFAVPYFEFINGGFNVEVASIQGGKAPIDPRSNPTPEQQSSWKNAIEKLSSTAALASIQHHNFDAVFLPGGHGTMFDLPDNKHLQTILSDFYEADKPIAAVCHGPAGLVNVMLSGGAPMVEGKTVTGFTNEEESAAGLTEKMPFLLESRLKEQKANFIAQPNWSDHVEVDGKLITGQNPQSSQSTALALIALLTK